MRRRGYPWVVVLALCLGGMSGVLTACGGGGGESENYEIAKALCVDVPQPTDFTLSAKINDLPSDTTVRAEPIEGSRFNYWQVRLGKQYPTSESEAGAVIIRRGIFS